MRRFSGLFFTALISAFMLSGCAAETNNGADNSNAEVNATDNTPKTEPTDAKPEDGLMKREEGPARMKAVTTRMASGEKEGKVIEEQYFNLNDRLEKDIDYDFFGSGKVVMTTTFTYNPQGKVTEEKEVSGDGKTEVRKFSYNAEGHVAEQIRTGGDEDGIHKYTYDEKGNVTLETVSKEDGSTIVTKEMEYTYDADGNQVEYKAFETKPGGEKTMTVHVKMQYKNGNMMVEELLDMDGNVVETSKMKYDEKGNMLAEENFKGDEFISGSYASYTPYGEIEIVDEQEGDAKMTLTYKYDEYGNKVYFKFDDKSKDSYSERIAITYNKR